LTSPAEDLLARQKSAQIENAKKMISYPVLLEVYKSGDSTPISLNHASSPISIDFALRNTTSAIDPDDFIWRECRFWSESQQKWLTQTTNAASGKKIEILTNHQLDSKKSENYRPNLLSPTLKCNTTNLSPEIKLFAIFELRKPLEDTRPECSGFFVKHFDWPINHYECICGQFLCSKQAFNENLIFVTLFLVFACLVLAKVGSWGGPGKGAGKGGLIRSIEENENVDAEEQNAD
jgi:hypothetical protein